MVVAGLPMLIDKWGPYLSLIAWFVIVICIKSAGMNTQKRRGFPVVMHQDTRLAESQKLTEAKPAGASLERLQNSD